jgi:ABC-type sugar transport system substrate-binding protein
VQHTFELSRLLSLTTTTSRASVGAPISSKPSSRAGIPTIILDRNVDTDKYTQFIGGDNVEIGRAAGEYTVQLLGGPGNAKGNVIELWGRHGHAAGP